MNFVNLKSCSVAIPKIAISSLSSGSTRYALRKQAANFLTTNGWQFWLSRVLIVCVFWGQQQKKIEQLILRLRRSFSVKMRKLSWYANVSPCWRKLRKQTLLSLPDPSSCKTHCFCLQFNSSTIVGYGLQTPTPSCSFTYPTQLGIPAFALRFRVMHFLQLVFCSEFEFECAFAQLSEQCRKECQQNRA